MFRWKTRKRSILFSWPRFRAQVETRYLIWSDQNDKWWLNKVSQRWWWRILSNEDQWKRSSENIVNRRFFNERKSLTKRAFNDDLFFVELCSFKSFRSVFSLDLWQWSKRKRLNHQLLFSHRIFRLQLDLLSLKLRFCCARLIMSLMEVHRWCPKRVQSKQNMSVGINNKMKKKKNSNNDWLPTEICNRSGKWIHSSFVGIEVNESIHRRLSVSLILFTVWPSNREQWVSAMEQVVPRSSNQIECVYIWCVVWSAMSIEMMRWIALPMSNTHGSRVEDERESLLSQEWVRHVSSLFFLVQCEEKSFISLSLHWLILPTVHGIRLRLFWHLPHGWIWPIFVNFSGYLLVRSFLE